MLATGGPTSKPWSIIQKAGRPSIIAPRSVRVQAGVRLILCRFTGCLVPRGRAAGGCRTVRTSPRSRLWRLRTSGTPDRQFSAEFAIQMPHHAFCHTGFVGNHLKLGQTQAAAANNRVTHDLRAVFYPDGSWMLLPIEPQFQGNGPLQ